MKVIEYMKRLNMDHMEIIWSIEDKYGTMENCPVDDPLLKQLHDEFDIYDLDEYDEYIRQFDKESIDEVRRQFGISGSKLSTELGYSRQWFHALMIDDIELNKRHIDELCEYFDVDESEFMRRM